MGCEGLGGKEIEVDRTGPSEEWRREVRGSHMEWPTDGKGISGGRERTFTCGED